MSISTLQAQAFQAASGIHVTSLTLLIQVTVGGVAVLSAVLVLIGLMRLLETNIAYDKVVFVLGIMGLAWVLMLVFIYLA